MNRPGQQPQRPPNLGPTPNIGGFRGPYQQAYGLPPRGVMQGYPAMQNHRAQSLVPQPSPGFIQQRTVGANPATAFNFAGNMQQQQQQQAAAQQSTQPHQHQQQSSSLQQQQPQPPHPQPQLQNVPTNAVPPHLSQQVAPGLNSATQNNSEGLDPNDFPALGSGNAPGSTVTTNSNANLHSSYATQAGTGVLPASAGNASGAQGTGAGQTSRDLGPDDFPALGSHAQQQQQGTPQTQEATVMPHPPGINGFQQNDQTAQQHRQTLIGSMTASGLQTQQQSMLGQQTRGLHAGFDSEKRNFAKLNQNWNSGNTQNASTFPQNLTNGTASQQLLLSQQQQTAQQQAQQQAQHLNAPPGVPPPSTYAHQHQFPPPAADTHHPHPPQQTSSVSNNVAHPQTPAQQLLMSPADRWGLLGLLALIKSADPDMALLSIGADLANLGLNVGQAGNIYSNFITPWSDSTAAATVEPEFNLPACYNVQPPPPGPTKAAAFSDETLFFMFYSSPRDALQEVAAQELWNRNWRWHKELRHWLTKETGTSPSQKVPGGEAGTYTFWDPESWTKERKELTVLYADLEEKSMPAFVQGPGLQPHPQSQPSGMSVAVGSQMGIQGINVAQLRQQVQAQAQAQGGGYQGMGIVAGMA